MKDTPSDNLIDGRQVAPGADVDSFNAIVESLMVEGYVDSAVQKARVSQEKKAVACWEHRGCEGLMGLTSPMEQECPHNRSDCYAPCPTECTYTFCRRPWHCATSDITLLFDETVNRKAAVKKACYTCEYFLTQGPRIGDAGSTDQITPDTATPEQNGGVTIHLF